MIFHSYLSRCISREICCQWVTNLVSFEGVGGEGFFVFFPSCSQCVPIMFPKCSQIYSLKYSQQHLGFIPYGLPKFTPMYINQKGEIQGSKFYSILQLGVQRDASNGGTPNVPQKIADGPINMAPSKRKSCQCTNDLINMNHTNGKATTRPIKQFDQSTTRFRSQP